MADAKKAAFRAVARDEIATLADLLNSPTEEWSKWTNQAGQTLLALCKERGSFQSYALLAKAIGVGTESGKLSKEEPSARAFRAAAQDDMAALAEILGGLSVQTWLRWRNKAGKDLLTMSLERGKLGAHAVLRKALASPLPVVQVAEAEEPTAAAEAQQTSPLEAEEPAAPGKAEEPPPAQMEPSSVQMDSAEEKEARKKSAEEARARAEERRAQEKLDSEKKAVAKSELDAKIARQAKKVEEDESIKAAEQAEVAARQAQKEAGKKAEEDAQKAAEEQAEKKAEEEVKQKVEEDAKQKAEEEAKRKAEEEAKKNADEEAKKKAEEEEARKKAEEEAKVKAKQEAEKAAEEARKKAEEEKRNRPPPSIGGELLKKGTGGWLRKAWDQRYVVVQGNKFSWYKQKGDVGKADPIKMVELCFDACEMVADPTNATYMTLRPKSGNWKGQDFKGADEGREFVFDAAGSEHSRESWIKATNLHCEFAQRQPATQPPTQRRTQKGLFG